MAAKVARDYQIESVNALFRFFQEKKEGNPLVGLPTGTGKAFVIADFVQKALRAYAKQKIIITTHVKELVDQNYLEFLELWPSAPAGIYSAGLGRKETHCTVTFAGIASLARMVQAFGKIDLFLIDEAHLLSDEDETLYMKVINFLLTVNPKMRVIGFTATPWRQGIGLLTNGKIFTDFAIDLTDMASFNRFIKEGYLVPLVSKPTQTILDVSGVHLRMGEFKQDELNAAVNKDEITYGALQETLSYAAGRRSWLVFATSLEHADKIKQMLEYLGVSCRAVHSKMGKKERDKNIADWKALKFTAIINMGVLTTGVNHPALDLIVMLRPTMSTVLWVQMLGRGTRPLFAPGYDINTLNGRLSSIAASEKQNCLVMDFAQNIKRLGPINDPVIPRKKGEARGEVPIKTCDACGMYNHISARYCGGEKFKTNEGCGAEFTFQVKLRQAASTEQIIKDDIPIVETLKVDRITFDIHRKVGKPDSIRVIYYCGFNRFNEFVMPEHQGFGRRKAQAWWERRTNIPLPGTTEEAMAVFDRLDVPTHIKVWINKTPYPQILTETFIGAFEQKIIGNEVPF
jgi:DNA repair protein RadD